MKKLLATISITLLLFFTACESSLEREKTTETITETTNNNKAKQEITSSSNGVGTFTARDDDGSRSYTDVSLTSTGVANVSSNWSSGDNVNGNLNPAPVEAPSEFDRKLVKMGDIEFETDNPESTKNAINKALVKYHGYIASEDENKTLERINNTLVVRLDAKYFDAFLNELGKSIEYFDRKNVNVQDVTEEYFDITARLKTKKELEARYLALLKQAKTIKEILEIEQYIEGLRYQIESYEGRLRYLSDRISLSTITISYYKIIKEPSPKVSGFSEKISNAFMKGWNAIKWLIIGVISLWPFVLIVTLVALGFKKRFKAKG